MLLKRVDLDLVLMDVQMPEMDGLSATREIRSVESVVLNPQIPIVAMTAHAMKGDREQCLSAGMNDYVSKPVRPKELLEAVQRWAGKKEPLDGQDQDECGSPPSVPLDLAQFDSITGGNQEFAREIVDLFLEDSRARLNALSQAIVDGDARTVDIEAHTMKGAGASFGANPFMEAALALEKKGKTGSLEGAEALLTALEEEFERVGRFFKEEVIADSS